ncbi:hypothetical protein BGZ81_010479 [Podila clonocystis]|nr:hypothetical protein BGZ81_010479 [Podila clonocystis]
MYLNLTSRYKSNLEIDEPTRKQAQEIFHRADTSKDGKLQSFELLRIALDFDKGVAPQDVSCIMKALDVDDSSDLSFEEFLPFVELVVKNGAAREEEESKWKRQLKA